MFEINTLMLLQNVTKLNGKTLTATQLKCQEEKFQNLNFTSQMLSSIKRKGQTINMRAEK